MTELITFRDRAYQASPRWLRGWWGSRLVYALAIHFDVLIDWAAAAIHARYPSWCAVHMPDALALHGRDRGIVRGFAESAVSYAVRLARWWIDRKSRGSLFACMDQLAGYLSGFEVTIRCVNLNGAWMTRLPDGTREYHRETPSNWNWDAYTAAWSRYWVIIYPPADLWVEEGYLADDGEMFGDGQLGSTITQDQADTLRAIIADWNPPHARCDKLILTFNPASFSPTAAPGFPMPETDWIQWWTYSGGGDAYETRIDYARYCEGVAS